METGYTFFEYLYRDAGNFKSRGGVLLYGEPSESDRAAFDACLELEGLFVAEQVGLPALYEPLWALSNGPTENDHAYHEFVEFRPASQDEVFGMISWGKVSDLIARFQEAKWCWDCALSPCCYVVASTAVQADTEYD